MMQFYPDIRLIHIVSVLLSGGIFSLRGGFMLAHSAHSQHRLLKYGSYANDSILLTAGLMLLAITQQSPFSQAWLGVKLSLLLVYIVLGVFALRRGRSYGVRAACFAAALMVYLFILSVAHWHDPWGIIHAF